MFYTFLAKPPQANFRHEHALYIHVHITSYLMDTQKNNFSDFCPAKLEEKKCS